MSDLQKFAIVFATAAMGWFTTGAIAASWTASELLGAGGWADLAIVSIVGGSAGCLAWSLLLIALAFIRGKAAGRKWLQRLSALTGHFAPPARGTS
jgi:hypothetical protein